MSRDESSRGVGGEPEWLTLGQAAKFLGIAQSTLRKWADREIVPCIKTPGEHRRFLRRDLELFLERSRPGARREGPVVLIVDDDPGLRSFIRVNLEAEGYVVREAGSAEEGLEALDEEPPALILLDVSTSGTASARSR
jgi:excisionase family DNA binding protein